MSKRYRITFYVKRKGLFPFFVSSRRVGEWITQIAPNRFKLEDCQTDAVLVRPSLKFGDFPAGYTFSNAVPCLLGHKKRWRFRIGYQLGQKNLLPISMLQLLNDRAWLIDILEEYFDISSSELSSERHLIHDWVDYHQPCFANVLAKLRAVDTSSCDPLRQPLHIPSLLKFDDLSEAFTLDQTTHLSLADLESAYSELEMIMVRWLKHHRFPVTLKHGIHYLEVEGINPLKVCRSPFKTRILPISLSKIETMDTNRAR